MLADREFSELSTRLTPERCAQLVSSVTDVPASHAPIVLLREELRAAGLSLSDDSLERALLRGAATIYGNRIADLAVYPPVRARLEEEIRFFTQAGEKTRLPVGSHLFITGCKMVSLRRFPAGPMDWEVSGIPRSWLLKMPKRDLPGVAVLLARMGGFAPLFFMHVARRPKNRSLLIEKEVRRSYYRMAKSLILQPKVLGIMASAWFHDPAIEEHDPHLAFMNRLYREGGGLITTTGAAPDDSGFLEHNAARQEQLKSGRFTCRLGLAIWPRRQAIDWAQSHPEFEELG